MLNTKNKNKGQVLVLVALSLVVFIGFAALAIDVGYFYHTKNQLQGAADAAALAGAARLKSPSTFDQYSARSEAWRFACKNKAAGRSVFLDYSASNCNSVPTNLPHPSTFDDSLDIVVGHWDGNDVIDDQPVDAVKVRARRTGGTPTRGMPKVGTFFGRIFGVDAVNISTTAIAARFPAEVLPIAVNEYWLQRESSGQRAYTEVDAKGRNVHDYPNSFVREDTVERDGTKSIAFKKIFGILGTNADDNVTPAQDVNSYVNVDMRSRKHDGGGASWFNVKEDPPALTCGINCGSVFENISAVTKKTGEVSQEKFSERSLGFIHNGFPEDYPLPTAVREQFILSPKTYPDNTNEYYPDPTSECPYATVPFFATGGNPPIQKTFEGKSFYDSFPVGKKLVALVYDGALGTTSTGVNSPPNTGTIVGYVLLQIDGYADEPPKELDLGLGSKGSKKLGDKGKTAYAHALQSIVEPSESESGECDETFFNAVKNLQIQGGSIRLVK